MLGWVPTHYKVKLQLILRLTWVVTISCFLTRPGKLHLAPSGEVVAYFPEDFWEIVPYFLEEGRGVRMKGELAWGCSESSPMLPAEPSSLLLEYQ